MKRKLVIRKTTKSSDWIDYTFNHIERFVDFEKENYEVVDETEIVENDEVFFVGYDTTNIVKDVIFLNNKGINATIIENLCCDESTQKHKDACETLFLNDIIKIRSAKFLQNELKEFVKKSLDGITRQNIDVSDSNFLASINLDSIELFNLRADIEDEYNTHLETIAFTKPFKFGEIYKLLEKGFIANKFD